MKRAGSNVTTATVAAAAVSTPTKDLSPRRSANINTPALERQRSANYNAPTLEKQHSASLEKQRSANLSTPGLEKQRSIRGEVLDSNSRAESPTLQRNATTLDLDHAPDNEKEEGNKKTNN
jgi:hypothetical protein